MIFEYDRADIIELERRVAGAVLGPRDEGYDAERIGYQLADAHRPAVIVGATGTSDVVAAVEFAAARGERIAVQATGHGLGAAMDGGVLITTRRMDAVEVDPVAGTARFEAGVRAGALLAATAPHGLVPLVGSSPSVGAVSYMLGGGIGLLARRHGYAADHVRALEVVTPDGRVRTVSADEEPELFWGLRGGGGNLAVVLAMEVDLQPLERFYGGGIFLDLGVVPDAVDRWRRWTDQVSEDVTSAVSVVHHPDAPDFPPLFRGRHVAQIQIVHLGSSEDAEKTLAELRELPVLLDTAAERPADELGAAFDEPDFPHPYRSRSRLVSRLDPGPLSTLIEQGAPSCGLFTVVAVRHLGGALTRAAAVPNAIGLRDAGYSVGFMSILQPGQESLADATAAAALAPFDSVALGRSLNFTYGPLDARDVRDGYRPADADRLADLRVRTDPRGLLAPNYEVRALAHEADPV